MMWERMLAFSLSGQTGPTILVKGRGRSVFGKKWGRDTGGGGRGNGDTGETGETGDGGNGGGRQIRPVRHRERKIFNVR